MTAHHRTRRGRPHFHCLGVGVGPANLSLASLMHPHSSRISHLFLDRKPSFGWHDGQQIPGAVLQVSPLKDLVTLADPTNPFSFLAYLHEQGRIYHYINAQFDAVPRQEFRNYLEWASHRNSNIVFGEEVLSVTFDGASGGAFVVHTGSRTLSADNLAIGVGSTPWVPPFAEPQLGTSQFHVSRFRELAGDLTARRVVVVGGGQSGAEAFLDLISRPEAELPRQVSWVSRRRNFLPIDDSPFTNDFFMPCHSEYFFGLDRPTRTAFNSRHVLASDGITESTLRSIYQQVYVHRFTGEAKDLTSFHPNREVTAVTGSDAEGWRIRLAHNDAVGAAEWLEADVVVWATGLRPGPMDFLDPIAGRLERDGDEYRIDRDFAVRWDGPPDRSLFLQNAARGQRGLADPNLSLSAWRSMRILDRLRGTHTPDQLPSFISWGPESPAGTPGEDR